MRSPATFERWLGLARAVSHQRHLTGHTIGISADLGWDRLKNGDLIAAAEEAGYEALLTTDKNLRYRQNLKDRSIAIIVIAHAQWPGLAPFVERVVDAINVVTRGGYIEVVIPLRPKKSFTRP